MATSVSSHQPPHRGTPPPPPPTHTHTPGLDALNTFFVLHTILTAASWPFSRTSDRRQLHLLRGGRLCLCASARLCAPLPDTPLSRLDTPALVPVFLQAEIAMKHVAALLLAQLGGNATPSAAVRCQSREIARLAPGRLGGGASALKMLCFNAGESCRARRRRPLLCASFNEPCFASARKAAPLTLLQLTLTLAGHHCHHCVGRWLGGRGEPRQAAFRC